MSIAGSETVATRQIAQETDRLREHRMVYAC